MVNNNIISTFLLFFLSIINAPHLFSQHQYIEVSSQYETVIQNELTEDDLHQILTSARLKAIEVVLPTEIAGDLLVQEEQNKTGFSRNISSEITSKVYGVWVKDITPPEFTYFKKGRENWILVRVHGYVTKRPNKTQAREMLLKQITSKHLLEDVQVHSIEYYPNYFLVTIVVLDSIAYKSQSEMNRVATILAKRQILTYIQGSKIEDVFVYLSSFDGNLELTKNEAAIKTYTAVKETSSGWVNSLESLDRFQIKDTSDFAFVFIKEIEQ